MLASYKYKNTAEAVAVKDGPGVIHAITLTAAGDTATLILYDNTAGSGTVIWKLSATANTSTSAILDVAFGTGCYAAVTGTTPSASIAFG